MCSGVHISACTCTCPRTCIQWSRHDEEPPRCILARTCCRLAIWVDFTDRHLPRECSNVCRLPTLQQLSLPRRVACKQGQCNRRIISSGTGLLTVANADQLGL